MTPGECLKRAAAFLDQIHAETLLSGGRADYPRDVIEGIAELKRGVAGLGNAEIREKPPQGMGGMLEQWAREEAEEKLRSAQARVLRAGQAVASMTYPDQVAGYAIPCEKQERESAASAFRNAAQRAREIQAGGPASTDDVAAISDLYEALAPFLGMPVPPPEEPVVPGIAPDAGNIAMLYDGDERRLYDTIIGTLISQQTWSLEAMSNYAENIIKARRKFFDRQPMTGDPLPAQTPFLKVDPQRGLPMTEPLRAHEYREKRGAVPWLFNPWTGAMRHPTLVMQDVQGYKIEPTSDYHVVDAKA